VALKDFLHPSSSREPQRTTALISLAGIRVLLVDDDLEQLELVAEILGGASASVVTATSVDAAIRQLARQVPDVIVSDISMPGCDGYHFLRMVRTRSPQDGGSTPAIALTGNTTAEHQSRAVLAGYQIHLAKPFRPIELLVAINSVVDSRRDS
jgi:CheY-like chemotaxis protein